MGSVTQSVEQVPESATDRLEFSGLSLPRAVLTLCWSAWAARCTDPGLPRSLGEHSKPQHVPRCWHPGPAGKRVCGVCSCLPSLPGWGLRLTLA